MGHEVMLNELHEQFHNHSAEVDISNALKNAYDHKNPSVDSKIDAAVKAEMIASAAEAATGTEGGVLEGISMQEINAERKDMEIFPKKYYNIIEKYVVFQENI